MDIDNLTGADEATEVGWWAASDASLGILFNCCCKSVDLLSVPRTVGKTLRSRGKQSACQFSSCVLASSSRDLYESYHLDQASLDSTSKSGGSRGRNAVGVTAQLSPPFFLTVLSHGTPLPPACRADVAN